MLALYTPNSIDTPAIVWGTHFAGGIISPANPAYTVEELVFQLRNSGAKALATQLPLIENARKAARKVGLPENRIILLGDEQDATFRHFTSLGGNADLSRHERVKINDPSKELAFWHIAPEPQDSRRV